MSMCFCGGDNKLIYACAGCSDVGELSYKVAKNLSSNCAVKMTCLAGVSAHIDSYITSAKTADANITIDGCPMVCAKKILQHIGIEPISFIITDSGFVKGKTQINEETILKAVKDVKEKIRGKNIC
jgi:uncharacterized metal-binding protein